MVKFLLVALFLAFSACKSQQSSMEISDDLKTSVREQLGERTSFQLNQTKSFLLCTSHAPTKGVMPPGPVQFMVYEQADETLLIDKTLEKGTVEWYSDHELLIKTFPGIVKTGETEENYIYLLDVTTGKQRKLNSLK